MECRVPKQLMIYDVVVCSFEVIYSMVPDSHHKLLKNMRKAQQRKERHKLEEMTKESSRTADDDWPRKRKHDTYVGLMLFT